MVKSISVLNIEDSEDDSKLISRLLKKAGYKLDLERIENAVQMRTALTNNKWDVIIADCHLPRFTGHAALKILQEMGLDIPFIAISGTIGEEAVVDMMKAGAHDYLMKDNLTRLLPTVERELEYGKVRHERKKAEEALLESEARLRQVWDVTSDSMALSDADGIVLDVNPAYLNLYGYTREEIIGHSFSIIFPLENRDSAIEQYKNTFTSDTVPATLEATIKRADGTQRVVESKPTFIMKAGVRVAMLSTIRDITDQKQADAALRISEKRFRALIENSLDDISLLNAEGILLWESPSVVRNLDYPANEMVNHSMFELMHPDDLERTQLLFAKLVKQPGSRKSGSFRLKHRDRSWRWVEAIATNLLHEPGIQAIVVNYRDITSRQEVEDALRRKEMILAQAGKMAHLGAWELEFGDVENMIDNPLHWSDEIYRIFGYKPGTVEVTNDLFFSHVHPDDRKIVTDAVSQALAEKNPYEIEYRLIRADGSERIVLEHADITFDGSGQPLRMLGATQDITERKQANDYLRTAETKYRTLVEQIHPIIYMAAPHQHIGVTYISPQIKTLGFTEEEWIADPELWLRQIHPDDQAQVLEELEKIKQEKAPYKLEYRIRTRDGEIRWFLEEVMDVVDQDGNILFRQGYMLDITERKRVEDALQASESSLQGILQSTADGILAVNTENKVLFANDHFAEMWKIPKDMLTSKDDTSLLAYVLDQLTNPQDFIEKVQELYRSRHESFDLLYFKDGRIFERFSKPIISGENATGRVWSFRDVTQRKQMEAALIGSEQAHRTLFENVPIGLYRTSADGYMLDANPALVRMFGHEDRESLLAVKVENLYAHFGLNKKFIDQMDKSDSMTKMEAEFRKKDGTTFWAEDNVQIIRDENANPLFYEGSLADITQRKNSEQARHESEERFHSLFNRMMDGVYRSTHEGKFVDINPAMVKMFGYSSKEEMQNIDIKNELYFQAKERGSHILDTGQEETEVYRMRRKDGTEIWVEDHGSYIHDEHGNIIFHEGILRDVTDRKRADQLLVESEQRFRQAIIAANAIPYSLNYALDYYTFMGEGITQLAGYSLEEMTPALLDSIIVESVMHGKFEGMDLDKAVQLVREGDSGVFWRCDHRIITRSGAERWISDASIQVLDHQGKPEGAVGIIQDITERKQTEAAAREGEARYRSLFEDSPVSLWEEDFSAVKTRLDELRKEGVKDFRAYFKTHPNIVHECAKLVKIINVNKATLKLFGAKSKAELGPDLSGMIGDEVVELFQNELISIAQSKTQFEWEGINKTLDGRPIIIRLSLSVLPGYEETYAKVIISMVDITARMQAEIAIRESEKSLRESQMIAGLGNYVLDVQTGIWTSSHILNQIFGINEAYNCTVESWLALVHPDWRQEMSDYFTNEVLGKHIQFNKEYKTIRNNDGSERWVHGLGELELDSNNQPVKMHGTIQDITDRKQAEENVRESEKRYRALFEDMPVSIWEEDFSKAKKHLNSLKEQGVKDFRAYFDLNPDAVIECNKMIDILDVNQATLKMYAAPSKEDLFKSMDESLSESETRQIVEAMVAIAEGKSSHNWEGPDITITGKPIEVSLNWSVVPGYEADFSRVIVTTVDITERIKVEAESKYQLSELEALYENGLAISRLLEPKRIAQRMVEVIDQKLDWHHAAIRLYDASTDRVELLALNSPGFSEAEIAEQIERINQTINTPDKGLSGWVIRHGEVVRIDKLKNDPRYIETYAGIKSGLYVPIKMGDQIIGSIAVESEHENAFSERDSNTLMTLANQAAISFINARLYLWLQKELDERHRAEEQVRKLNVELEQRVAERTAQIEATKRRLELATHAGQIGVWEYNPRENKVIWDERMHEIHHIPIGEFDGKSQTWATLIHPEDIEQSQINRQLAVTKNLLLNNEHRIIWPDGSIRHIMSSAVTAYSADGTPDRIIGINMDITERKQTEQSLRESETYARLLFDAVPDPVFVTKADGLIVDVNKVFEEQYAVSSAEIRGKHMYELDIYPETELVKQEKYLSGVLQGQTMKPVELDFYVPGDRIHTLEMHSYLLKDNERQLVLNTTHDITAHKKAEETQRIAKSEIERALRIKNEFLANMSHELRTPLNSILGISESLEEQIVGVLNEKQLKYIGIVRESGRHLLELINDILDLSKIEAGRMELDIHRLSIETICQSSLRMVKELSQKKSINVSFTIKGDIKVIVADQRRLKQSLVNLLSNAVKFTPAGKEIGLEVSGNTETNEAQFTVWDQGVGIAPEDIKLLFKPFVQLDAGLAREYQGTGLGLALVLQMINLHGGHVSVQSEPEKGSRFTITLPWLPTEQTPRAQATGELTTPVAKSDKKYNGRILLVEDTEVVIQLISEYLRYKGYEVILANNGAQGVELAMKEHPDLILMDVMMPIMDGLEATQKMRKVKALQKTPIIALTALAMAGDSDRCLAAGMNDYLSKPIQMQNLADMIEKYLGSAKEETDEK